MRKKEKPKEKKAGEGEAAATAGAEGESEFCGRVRLKYLRCARNNGNNIGCLATALFTSGVLPSTLASPLLPFRSNHPLRSGSLPAPPFPARSQLTQPPPPLGPIFHSRTSLAEGQRREVIDIVAMPRESRMHKRVKKGEKEGDAGFDRERKRLTINGGPNDFFLAERCCVRGGFATPDEES